MTADVQSHTHHDAMEQSGHHDQHGMGDTRMAISATLLCLTGCAIGEIAGLIIGTAAGLGNAPTIAISIALSFMFGYTLSTMTLLRAGLAPRTALTVVIAADTLSIGICSSGARATPSPTTTTARTVNQSGGGGSSLPSERPPSPVSSSRSCLARF